jgi:PhnB protein
MPLQPYVYFEGRCEEAIEFYRKAIGAEVQLLMRYKDAPEPHRPDALPPGHGDKVMHATLRIGGSTMQVSDGRCKGPPKFDGFSLSLTVSSEADAKRFFAALSDGGQVLMPMAKTFFSANFGMVTDRFGVMWLVYIAR